jgi:hypothetical protein
MDSNIIKFRLSPEVLWLLESARNDDESLHQTAKRILESNLKTGTQTGHTEQVSSTQTGYTEQVSGTQIGHTEAEAVHTEQVSGTQLEDTTEDIRTELKSEINKVRELLANYQEEISKKLTA